MDDDAMKLRLRHMEAVGAIVKEALRSLRDDWERETVLKDLGVCLHCGRITEEVCYCEMGRFD